MAKSARSSGIKKNNTALRKKVFGPVEKARNERLSAKLLALAQQEKPPRREMEAEQNEIPLDSKADPDAMHDADGAALTKTTTRETRSNTQIKKAKEVRKGRNDKHRHRKVTANIAFAKHPSKVKKGGKR
ncbi:hypothetical protein LTR95_004075 [Oleoguttula sp. CCFEE 5521]